MTDFVPEASLHTLCNRLVIAINHGDKYGQEHWIHMIEEYINNQTESPVVRFEDTNGAGRRHPSECRGQICAVWIDQTRYVPELSTP